MTESIPGGPRRLTHADLTSKVRSLRAVGGIYEDIAEYVEHDNRQRCLSDGDEAA